MSFCTELFCVVTLQYQILVIIAIAYFIIEKKKTAPQPWQAIAQRFCSIPVCWCNTCLLYTSRFRIMDSEPEKRMELRRMFVDNYSVFYTICDERVIVTDVLYTASDIEARLRGEL